MGDLIDTTEMYLKTVYEMEEDGVTPLRARIVERLNHSGPTVSQTVARMERDGLLHVLGDRRLELTGVGRERAVEVMRKHRLAERLLLDVVGLEWALVHDEACRWEHVMSDQVEDRLVQLLHSPAVDPFGNPIPGAGGAGNVEGRGAVSVEVALRGVDEVDATIGRIGEPIQAQAGLIQEFDRLAIRPGVPVRLSRVGGETCITPLVNRSDEVGRVALPGPLDPHLFVDLP